MGEKREIEKEERNVKVKIRIIEKVDEKKRMVEMFGDNMRKKKDKYEGWEKIKDKIDMDG